MRFIRLAQILVMFFALRAFATAAEHESLTTLAAIVGISNVEAQRRASVAFEATVTYFSAYRKNLFVQDGNDAIFVAAPGDLKLTPGDRVLIHGEMHPSFRPFVDGTDVKVVGRSPLPEPKPATFQQLIRADLDCRLVKVRATVRSVDLIENTGSLTPATAMHVLVNDVNVNAWVGSDSAKALNGLLDTEVEITAVAAGQFDNKMQKTGVLLNIQSLREIKVLKRAAVDPWSVPVASMDRIIEGREIRDLTRRMRVHGAITYYEPGNSVVLQDGAKSLHVTLSSWPDARVGDLADAIGFPDLQDGFLTLTHSEVRDERIRAPIGPTLYRWRDLAVGGNNGVSHIFDLVSIDGQVVTEVRQATQDEYVLQGDGHLFSAILRHARTASSVPLEPMQRIPVGSRIRVTGICMLADANPFNGEVPFNILMRSFDDVQILTRPPWLNVTHLLYLVAALLIAIVAVGARGWFIEHRTRRRTTALAHIEQRRSRILENMNASRPLADILEQITAVVSYKLRGMPCWCEIVDGATLGNRPNEAQGAAWQVIDRPIPSHSGARFGSMFVALVGRRPSPAEAHEALAQAVGLASLAIETSRLHSDLVHRSEFDLLTDVRNRFSLERVLDAQIELARQSVGMLGLIYIDLNEFKQVNDRFGHLAGDTYLQEAAARMKGQLRPGDTLARLGGDEFAVLVGAVRNRAGVVEVAERLNHCFDEPFVCEGVVLHGSASIGIALYPADGTTRDSLLSAADASMYARKNHRRRAMELSAELK